MRVENWERFSWRNTSSKGGSFSGLRSRLWALNIWPARGSRPTTAIFAGEVVAAIIPRVPAHSWLVYLTGFALVAAGVSLAANLKLPMTSILLGSSFRVSVLFLEISRMIHSGARTALFETLALGATALTVVRTSPVE